MPFMPPSDVFSARISTPVLHPRRALKRRVEADVLIGLVEHQPAAARLFRRADDLAVLRAPRRRRPACASRSAPIL